MKKRATFFMIILGLRVVVCFSQTSTARETLPADFKEKAFHHIQSLAGFGIRTSGTENEAKSMDYIHKCFAGAGLDVSIESFEFETFILERILLQIGGGKYEPDFVVFDPYSGPKEISGQPAFIDPQTPRDKLQALSLADQIVITAVPSNYFQIAFKNPRSIIFLSPNDVERFKNSQNQTVVLKIVGAVKKFSSANIIGSLNSALARSQEKEIILSAHLDSVGGPGACDNGSGIGVLIELARYFKNIEKDLPCRLKFIAFGAEEIGMIGSRIYVSRHPNDLKNCELLFNIDTVGGDKDIYVEMRGGTQGIPQEKGQSQIPEALVNKAWADFNNKWKLLNRVQFIPIAANAIPSWLSEIIEASGKELGYTIVPSYLMGSDHRIFAQAGIPSTNIAISGCKTHNPEDTPQMINKESLEKAGNIVARVVIRVMSNLIRNLGGIVSLFSSPPEQSSPAG